MRKVEEEGSQTFGRAYGAPVLVSQRANPFSTAMGMVMGVATTVAAIMAIAMDMAVPICVSPAAPHRPQARVGVDSGSGTAKLESVCTRWTCRPLG